MSVPWGVYDKLPKRLPYSLGFSKYSLSFDGSDDNVRVPLSSSLDTDYVTVEIVAKVLSDTPDWASFIGKGDVGGAPYSWRILLYSGLKLGFGAVNSDGVERLTNNAASLQLDTWYHIVLTFDGTTIIGYLNGSQVWSYPLSGVLYKGGDIYLASRLGSDHFLNCVTAFTRIYNRALSDHEIRYNMLNYHSPIRNGLVLWLPFEEGTGLTAYDKSGQGNHGTIYGATWTRVKRWELRAEVGL